MKSFRLDAYIEKKALLIAAMSVALICFGNGAETAMTANERDANALFEMGRRYEAGVDVEMDAVKAAQCYRRAAELGLADAQFHLGRCYYYGKGVETNQTEAAKWHKKAADQGFHLAQVAYASCCLSGNGVEKNIREAIKWLQRATEQGNVDAQVSLGICYLNAFGVEKNENEAEKLFRMATEQGISKSFAFSEAEKGVADAQAFIGTRYIYVEKNVDEAVKWWRNAAEQGLPMAQYALGDCYYHHFNDKQEALSWYRKAAEQGNPDAQYNIGIMYLRGEGVEQNRQEAVKWIGKAADQGHKRAQDTLEVLDSNYRLEQGGELVGRLIGTVLFIYLIWGVFLLLRWAFRQLLPRAGKKKGRSVFPWWLMLLGPLSLVEEWRRQFDHFPGLVLLSAFVYAVIIFLHWIRCRNIKKQEANADA